MLPMLNFYKLQTVKFLEINWLSQNLAPLHGSIFFFARNLTLNYYNKLATMHCNRFSTILYISHKSLITLMKTGITKKC